MYTGGMWEMSTVHITRECAERLETNDEPVKTFTDNDGYGFIIHALDTADEYREEGMSKCLIDCIEYCAKNGFEWIRFDPDAEIINALPKYDW